MDVKNGPDTQAFSRSEYKSIIYINVTHKMTNSGDKIHCCVKCKIDVENELKEAYLASSVQAWRLVICRSH